MKLQELKELYHNHRCTQQISDGLIKNQSQLFLGGTMSFNAMIASAVFYKSGNIHLFLFDQKETAIYFYNDLQAINGQQEVLFFPSSSRIPYKHEESKNANILMRAEVLNRLGEKGNSCLVVSYPEAISEKVVTQSHLAKNTLELVVNQNYSIAFIDEMLLEYEFEKVDFVYEPGQFSIRGGIIDIFSFSNEDPFRVEFFGDAVESIRSFDTITQLSKSTMAKIHIVPNVQEKLLLEERQSFLDFIPENSKIWINENALFEEKINDHYQFAENEFNKQEALIQPLAPEELYISKALFVQQIEKFNRIYFGSLIENKLDLPLVKANCLPQPDFNKNFNLLASDLQKNTKNNFTNIVVADQSKQLERLYSIFEDQKAEVKFSPLKLSLSEGYIDMDLKLACYTDHQLFDRYHRFKLKEGFNKTKEALTLKELLSLQKGDYVTHIDHGVGQYSGLEKIDVNGKQQEAIRLIYKGGDVLYVSIHSLHRISKFTGKEGSEPTLHKLGSNTWANLKQKAKKKVKEIAFDLIQLYAKRKSTKGFQFSPDNYLQNELEASFIYEDTPDQHKATIAVKKDMESTFPMDRLVCGDVGFGKTEIAIRAAFKAVNDSKQVALLCPTTILSLQHFKSFQERFKDFPCKVDYINRFKSAKNRKETLEKLSTGEIDILIGTHAIVGKDVKFKDLGLLIIDEEQKFGVAVKDKLKLLKANIDSLTLTATPIPRTLQFSLMGARDLSVINTPPPNRHPIQTEISTFNEDIIRDKIMYEIARGGQVYFVHNRVQNIKELAGLLQRICPDIRIAIGHGQMDGEQLESIMVDFIEGQYDVLLATTIIESGIDIPNANTIIINDAHNFGLSDLHQLRGRVGRSNKRAFCLLLTQPMHTLTTEARKRLTAIEQFSDLGSGFSIAMRDLDIRGAGNLLGGEQSGFISDIGYETYQKILDEALQELKETDFKDLYPVEDNEKTEYVRECTIETDLEILIPDTYVNHVNERLILYRELDNINDEFGLQKFEQKLIDRFGPVPIETQELLNSIRLRKLAKTCGIERILLKNNRLSVYFVSNKDSAYYQSQKFDKILHYVQKNHGRVKMEEKNNRLNLRMASIHSIDEAIQEFQKMTT